MTATLTVGVRTLNRWLLNRAVELASDGPTPGPVVLKDRTIAFRPIFRWIAGGPGLRQTEFFDGL
jgi:hypothetical protein